LTVVQKWKTSSADYLLCVDYFTKYPEITKLNDMTSKQIIAVLNQDLTLFKHRTVASSEGIEETC